MKALCVRRGLLIDSTPTSEEFEKLLANDFSEKLKLVDIIFHCGRSYCQDDATVYMESG